MSYLDRIATCQAWRPERYRPFVIGEEPLGRVTRDFARRLADFPSVFQVSDRAVVLAPDLTDVQSRTLAVAEVLGRLAETGEIGGWRDEAYPITPRWDQPPRMSMERAAVPLFGCRAYGVHMNGLVFDGERSDLWVAKRALTKETAPGKLDHLVAGGQPQGIGVRDNLIKECAEEASIPPALARQAAPVGIVSYICERPEGLRRGRLVPALAAGPSAGAPPGHGRLQVQLRAGHPGPGRPPRPPQRPGPRLHGDRPRPAPSGIMGTE
jgi:hypothetical protein